MSSKTAQAGDLTPIHSQRRGSVLSRFLRHRLASAAAGRICVVLPSGERIEQYGHETGPNAEIHIRQWSALARLFVGGYNGFARAYIAGEWFSPNVATFFEWAACNDQHLDPAFSGAKLSQLLDRLRHLRRANTRNGSRRNISAHYDLGNAFYALWLDAAMNYSSGLFTQPGEPLEHAQRSKIERATQLLDLKGSDRVLEIGCGWGAMVEHLTSVHGCRVTGLTLSSQQRDFAVKRLSSAGVKPLSCIRLQDYRDETGQYDGIISIEMLEAVGEAYWPVFFEKLRSCLKPGGTAVIQSITIAEPQFEAYRRNPDFIQRYIFPGGMLPTIELIRRHIETAGLSLRSIETFGQSYALTLAAWRDRFQKAWPRALQLGFDERFKRTWEYYLAYCEAGFRTELLDVGLYKIVRPGNADHASRCLPLGAGNPQ